MNGSDKVFAFAKITSVAEKVRKRGAFGQGSFANVSSASLDEAFEDAQLNAIADERAKGPFVRVSLDDL